MKNIELYNQDCLEGIKLIPDNSIDVVCTDPPYLYLKNQKLEREFDEQLFFSECKRVLTKNGFVVLFGRGASFYRWNTILAGLEFNFKEEIIWDKLQTSSPMNALMRCHEAIVVYTKGDGKINKIKRPITEAYQYEPEKIEQTLYRLTTTFGNRKTFQLIKDYFDTGVSEHNEGKERRHNATLQSDIKKRNRTLQFCVSMEEGITEKSIFKETRDYYTSIHPTQKPVRLLERLLALVIPKGKPKEEITVLDPFGGSFSTMEAVYNMGMKGISFEIDKEYYEAGKERIEKLHPRQETLFD